MSDGRSDNLLNRTDGATERGIGGEEQCLERGVGRVVEDMKEEDDQTPPITHSVSTHPFTPNACFDAQLVSPHSILLQFTFQSTQPIGTMRDAENNFKPRARSVVPNNMESIMLPDNGLITRGVTTWSGDDFEDVVDDNIQMTTGSSRNTMATSGRETSRFPNARSR